MGKIAREKRPTIADVARLAGVSTTTVSFVLNNVPNISVSAETRARIHRAVAQLDYHPQEAARTLRNQASRTLTVAVPDANNPHFLQMFAGAKQYARSHGYDATLSITDFAVAEEQRCFDLLRKKQSDALLLSSIRGKMLLEDLVMLKRNKYIVTALTEIADAPIDCVAPEPHTGEALVLQHLVALGHRQIGYVYGVTNHEFLSGRLDACLAIQSQLGLPIEDAWICRCGPKPEDGYAATRALLQGCERGPRPTALIIVNDLLAVSALAALFAEGIAVPSAMSVVSFDNTSLASYTIPPLTTVDYRAAAMGEQAAALTIARLATPDLVPQTMLMPPHLVVRATTGPASVV